MTLKANKDGFLVGNPNETVDDVTEDMSTGMIVGQNTGNKLLSGIKTDVSAIAKALGGAGRSSSPYPVAMAAGRRCALSSLEGKQAMAAQRASGVGMVSARVTVSPSGRDGRGRFVGGRDGTGGKRILDKLDGVTNAIAGIGEGSEQIDPSIGAMKEIKDVVSPLGRGLFKMLGRSSEQKKERWYQRIWKSLRGIEHAPRGGGSVSIDGESSSIMGC
jgi:hypothetical protein